MAMPRRPEPEPKPDLSYDRAMPALERQLQELQNLKGRSYDEADADETQWQHLTEGILEHTFGKGSTNLNKFTDVSWIGASLFGGERPHYELQSNFERRINQYDALLKSVIEELKLYMPGLPIKRDESQSPTDAVVSQRVFVVHGHDQAMKEPVARALERLNLLPIILHEQPGGGRTLIEKFEAYSDVGFAVVLLAPDDELEIVNGDSVRRIQRARQNVILELGFFVGKLGRPRVAAIFKASPEFEVPSDFLGVEYILYDAEGSWKLRLVRELRQVGFDVDANSL
jgi:predicted nucleotide-binding protein